jgi:hypothetical protein
MSQFMPRENGLHLPTDPDTSIWIPSSRSRRRMPSSGLWGDNKKHYYPSNFGTAKFLILFKETEFSSHLGMIFEASLN